MCRDALRVLLRDETSFARTQIKLAFGPVCEQRPAIRADEDRRRHDGPEHRPVPSAPTRLHQVKRAAPIKLLRALVEAQHGSVRVKRDPAFVAAVSSKVSSCTSFPSWRRTVTVSG